MLWQAHEDRQNKLLQFISINSLCLRLETTLLFIIENFNNKNFLQSNINKKGRYIAKYKMLTIDKDKHATLNDNTLRVLFSLITKCEYLENLNDFNFVQKLIEIIVALRNDSAHGRWKLIIENRSTIVEFLMNFLYRFFILQAVEDLAQKKSSNENM